MPIIKHKEEDKGRQVRITGGVCEGRHGWLHKSANTFPDKAWIIVAGKSAEERDKSRLVAKQNISYHSEEVTPRNFEEALLREHPDIAKDMKRLAAKLAEFDSYSPNPVMISTFYDMWKDAKAKRSNSSRAQQSRFVRTWMNQLEDAEIVFTETNQTRALETTGDGSVVPTTVSIILDDDDI